MQHITLFNIPLKYLKYCLAGGAGAAVDFILYSSIIYTINLNYLVSNIFSFTFATIVVYFLQKNWTFQYATDKSLDTFNRFLQIVVITYILNNILLIIGIELLGIGLLISKVIQITLSLAWGYYANNFYVFNKN